MCPLGSLTGPKVPVDNFSRDPEQSMECRISTTLKEDHRRNLNLRSIQRKEIEIARLPAMKIFAKRKRKLDENPKPRSEVFKSDEQVAEILKKDPETWNAKERRMVKRFQKRKPEDANDPEKEEVVSGAAESEKIEDDSDQIEGLSQAEEAPPADAPADEDENDIAVDEQERTKTEEETGKSEATVDSELGSILEKLNSKQRRKLTRSLERGEISLQDAMDQANAFALEAASVTNDNGKDDSKTEAESQGKSGKRRKVDWGTLPPEERLRREEQRRKQKEAEERRKSAPASKHKHPLNSERRRANRRKPKHGKNVRAGDNPMAKDHHFSGYQVRHAQKSEISH